MLLIILLMLTSFSDVVDKVGDTFGVMGTQDLASPILDARTEAIALGKSETELLTITKELSSNFLELWVLLISSLKLSNLFSIFACFSLLMSPSFSLSTCF